MIHTKLYACDNLHWYLSLATDNLERCTDGNETTYQTVNSMERYTILEILAYLCYSSCFKYIYILLIRSCMYLHYKALQNSLIT